MRIIIAVFGLILSGMAYADAAEQMARHIHRRIAGVPPTTDALARMASALGAAGSDGKFADDKIEAAARIAMEDNSFYKVTLYKIFARWFDLDNALLPVQPSDGVLSLIGAVKDDANFAAATFYDDGVYIFQKQGANLPAPSDVNNNHYTQGFGRADIDFRTDITRVQASTIYPQMNDFAGVITSRGVGEVYWKAGTNRRPVPYFVMKNLFCHAIDKVADNTVPKDAIRQDVQRAPAGPGSEPEFNDKCAGCHASLDPVSNSGCYTDWDDTAGRLFQGGTVRPKCSRTDQVPPVGQTPTGNYWEWRFKHPELGWKGPKSGSGLNSLGHAFAESEAFPKCMASHVFNALCNHAPETIAELDAVDSAAADFAKDKRFRFKDLWTSLAPICLGIPLE